jgi:hypothetical protein
MLSLSNLKQSSFQEKALVKILEDVKASQYCYLLLLRNLSMGSHFHFIVGEPIMIFCITCLTQGHFMLCFSSTCHFPRPF